jgi:CSLREA domain-containing protein
MAGSKGDGVGRRRRTTSFLGGLVLAFSLAAAFPDRASGVATIVVTTTEDQFGAGGHCSLREALEAADRDDAFGGCPAGSGLDRIVLSIGRYDLTRPGSGEELNATGDLDIRSEVLIEGSGPGTVVDGGGIDRVIDVKTSGIAVVTSITVEGGRTSPGEDGAGIRNTGRVRLHGLTIRSNHAGDDGGGVLNFGGTAQLTVERSAILSNSAAGLNDTEGQGGQGGGARNFSDGSSTFVNVTVSGNAAESDSGGIDNDSGTTSIGNATITANTADTDGDGGNGGGIDQGGGTLTIRNSIVAGNADTSAGASHPDCSDHIISGGHNVIGNVSGCEFSAAPGDRIGTAAAPIDPGLTPLGDHGGATPMYGLQPGSPAIEGNPAPPGSGGQACAAVDQRGAPRSGSCDIGAYEIVFCLERLVNRVSIEGQHTIAGTEGSDGILGLGGRDVIHSGGGDDGVCAGGGGDTVNVGSGNDVVMGEAGRDVLRGSGGADLLIGGGGNDRIAGGSGRDVLRGEGGRDRLDGGPRRDRCRGGPGKDRSFRC